MKILRILIVATAIAGLASSCSSGSTKTITTIAEAESSPQVTNSYQSSSSSSSNSDAKVFEPSSCPDYQDSYSTPYKYCDSGSDVTTIQQALVDLGYSIDVDSYYGPRTRTAVKKYQSSKGLTVTGQVNDSTWSSLIGDNTPQYEYSDEEQPVNEVPYQPVITQQRQLVNIICDLRESALSSSWYGQSYNWTYYYRWSDGTRTVAKMGSGYDPPSDCL